MTAADTAAAATPRRMIAKIVSEQYDLTELSVLGQAISAVLRETDADALQEMLDGAGIGEVPLSETYELTTEATVSQRDGRFILAYDESRISGMEGCRTEISFSPANPELLFILRSGEVRTALALERGRRHICTYRTPYMPFELCVLTRRAENHLSREGGTLELDYFIEIKGAAVQRMKLSVSLRPAQA